MRGEEEEDPSNSLHPPVPPPIPRPQPGPKEHNFSRFHTYPLPLMAFFCGAGNFSHADDDPWPPSTPPGSKRRQGGDGSRNPYATRGLDKFSMVLADLETRRERIMAASGSQGVALVQFVYYSSDDWVPIVVRPREQPRPAAEKPKKCRAGHALKKPGPPDQERAASPPAEQTEVAHGRAVRKSLSWKASDGDGGGAWCRRPSRYLPVAVALVLLCLAVSGRAFAICCTSMWWYFVPIAAARGGESLELRRPVKEDHGRRRPVLPPRRSGGLEGLASPRKHHASMKRGS